MSDSLLSRLSLRELLIGGLLLLLMIGGFWVQSSRPPAERTLIERPAGEPDSVIENLRTLTMDEQGRPARELRSPYVLHFPQDDHSELETPRLTLFDPILPPWNVRAERAWVSAGSERILLQGAVEADRAASDLEPATRLQTRELLLIPDQDYAETDARAIMDRGSDRVIADQGFKAWLEPAMRIELFGRVKGRLLSVVGPSGEALGNQEAAND